MCPRAMHACARCEYRYIMACRHVHERMDVYVRTCTYTIKWMHGARGRELKSGYETRYCVDHVPGAYDRRAANTARLFAHALSESTHVYVY